VPVTFDRVRIATRPTQDGNGRQGHGNGARPRCCVYIVRERTCPSSATQKPLTVLSAPGGAPLPDVPTQSCIQRPMIRLCTALLHDQPSCESDATTTDRWTERTRSSGCSIAFRVPRREPVVDTCATRPASETTTNALAVFTQQCQPPTIPSTSRRPFTRAQERTTFERRRTRHAQCDAPGRSSGK
jgi:hypothetical protein